MNIRPISWVVLGLLHMGMTGNATAATVFTDRAAFEAALASYSLEDFEAYAVSGSPDADLITLEPTGQSSMTLGDLTVSTTPDAVKIWNAEHFGSHNTTPGGANFLYLDTDLGLQGVISADITLDSPVDAFGFSYTGVFEPGTVFTATIASDVFNLALNPAPAGAEQQFWGVIGLGSFTDITLYTSMDSAFGVDDVLYGTAVPLPPAIWLLGTGLLALAAGSAGKRKTSG